MTTDNASPFAALRTVVRQASRGLVDREVLVEVIVLTAVAGEHVLVVGPPGTAKSVAARRVAHALGGRYFEYLLGRFTEPSELFGAVDLAKLRDGLVETDTTNMLPEADIVFLDEVFQGSTAILNTLLGILNERTFIRGHTRMRCPLRLCLGATNALPADPSLAAFADRFLTRVFVEPVSDAMLEDLLVSGWGVTREAEGPPIASLAMLDDLSRRAGAVDMTAVVPQLAETVRRLRVGGVVLSDRRVVRAQKLIAAAAAFNGRDRAEPADIWPLIYTVPTAEQQATARDLLSSILEATDNAVLHAAAEDAARGPLIRARRLAAAADDLLAHLPPATSPDLAWKLRVEALLREIDAGFAESDRTPELGDRRQRLVEAITPAAGS
ncbi:MAG TPA: AAA family ATPase [Polyangia bacterium]|jgi:MoxR-like ATPase|nr:AAA family ATPase [Polyangia bacterium]